MAMVISDFGIVAIPSIDPTFNRAYARRLPGTSIARCVDDTMPENWGPSRKRIRVTLDGHIILPELWDKVKPKAGTSLVIEVVPGEGATLRSVLTIVVAIAAVAAGQFYGVGLATAILGEAAGAAGTIGAALTSAALSTAIVTAGTLLINALIPVKNDKEIPVYTINSLRNRLTPDGILPTNWGKNRVAPVYGMLPYSDVVGDDRFVNALLIVAKGTNRITAPQFGETDLFKYKDVTYEVREGFATDTPHTICNRLVIEKALNIGLFFGGPNNGPQYRVTARDVTDASVDITFPAGLGGVRKDGDKIDANVEISIRYRKVGTDVYSALQRQNIVASKMSTQFTRTFPIVFPERGQYEIEVNRVNGDYDFPEFDSSAETKRTGRSVWSALRSFRPEYPIAYKGRLTTIAVRMRGTAQLNGSIDELNVIASSMCDVIDPVTGVTTFQETNNPASLYRHEMLKVMAYPLAPTEIDEMREFYKFCRDKGLAYNRYINSDMSVLDLISEICAAGRATPHDTGEKWDVIIDQPMTRVDAHLSPENSYEFSGERPYVQFPHAFRVSFQDETNNYSGAERLIRWPGYDGEITITEALNLPGLTNPTQIWKEARRRQYEVIHRADTYKLKQEMESLTIGRGDRVLASFDLLDSTLSQGRVSFVSGNPTMGFVIAYTGEIEMDPGKVYGARFRRSEDGTSVSLGIMNRAGPSSDLFVSRQDSVLSKMPHDGDLIFVGEYSREAIACTVQAIERMDKFTAEITLKDHAPEIQELLDADVVPVWDGRVGKPIEGQNDTPNAPSITDIVSGTHAAGAATAAIPYPVIVSISMPAGSTVPLSGYEVRHRKIGMPGYTITATSSGSPRVLLPGYAKGDQIELSAHAISLKGTSGPYGSPNATHTVGSGDVAAPAALTVTLERSVTSAGNIQVKLRLKCTASSRARSFLLGRYRKVGDTAWQYMGADGTDLFSVRSDQVADSTSYEVQGAISTEAGGEISDYVVASGSPIAVVTDSTAPAAPKYLSATASGKTVTHAFKQSPSDNAKKFRLMRTRGFGKTIADATQVFIQTLGPNVQDSTPETIDAGLYSWYAQALNASDVVSPVSAESPRTILDLTQTGNKTQYPNDLNQAEWVKTGTTAGPVASPNDKGPDGATLSLLAEITGTTNVVHTVEFKPTGIVAGNKVRQAWLMKASGRNNGRLDFIDGTSGVTAYTRLLFDLTAGTVTTSSATGGVFTAAVGTIEKITADYFLITWQATTSSTNIIARLYMGNDAKALSYPGDSTKGLLLEACTLAVVP